MNNEEKLKCDGSGDLNYIMVESDRAYLEELQIKELGEIIDKKRKELPGGVLDRLLENKIKEIENKPEYKDLDIKRPRLVYIIMNWKIDKNAGIEFDYPFLEFQEYIEKEVAKMTDEVSP